LFENIYKITKYLNKALHFDGGLSILSNPNYDHKIFWKLSDNLVYRIKILINFLVMLTNIILRRILIFITWSIALFIIKTPIAIYLSSLKQQ
jgi:hypothetical protein